MRAKKSIFAESYCESGMVLFKSTLGINNEESGVRRLTVMALRKRREKKEMDIPKKTLRDYRTSLFIQC